MIATVACASAQSATGQRATAPRASVEASPAETLTRTVRAGETLIVALPARANGREVRYEIDRAPALSWLVDRSFMWRTVSQERGTLPVRFRRFSGTDSTPEIVVLMVEITA